MKKKASSEKKNLVRNVAFYLKLAKQGDASAQLVLGLMYDSGKGLKKDKKKAVAWYQKAAKQGDASAQLMLGLMSHDGEGSVMKRFNR